MSVKVKICGIKDVETAKYTSKNGSDLIGLIFFEKSPRNIDFKTAAAIANSAISAKLVAVIVNASDEFISEMLANFTPDYIQLHGSETRERTIEIKEKFKINIIKAISISEAKDLTKAEEFKDIADLILFDAKPPKNSNLPGGNAVSFDWEILNSQKFDYPWILSGGLNISNIEQAIKISGADFIDISSGVEKKPGKKDKILIKDFLNNVQ